MTAFIDNDPGLHADFAYMLWHVADVRFLVSSGVDEDNQEIVALGSIVPDIPCRFKDADSNTVAEARVLGIEHLDAFFTLKHDQSVQVGMQFENIRNVDGTIINSSKFTMQKSLVRRWGGIDVGIICYCSRQ